MTGARRLQVPVPRVHELGLWLAAEAGEAARARRELRALLHPAPHLLPQEQHRARPATLRAARRGRGHHMQRVLLHQHPLTTQHSFPLLAHTISSPCHEQNRSQPRIQISCPSSLISHQNRNTNTSHH